MPLKRIIDVFEEIAQKYPEHHAIWCERYYNYQELRRSALRFASFLKTKAALTMPEEEPRVVLNLSKSAEYIIAVLGCFYAGWAFTPVDPSLPKRRQDFIIDDVKPHVIISESDLNEVLSVDPLEGAEEYSLNRLAYIIYTSGSTGQPKGVMLEHKGLYNVIEQQIKQFDISAGDRSLLLLSIQFDASLSDIFCALLSGACLYIEKGDRHHVASALPDILAKHNITHLDIPPSFLRVLTPEQMPDSLRSIIIGGEVCPADTVKRWADHVLLNNVYGPTEATICTSMIACDGASWDKPLIGEAMDHVEYYIDDGELLIAGVQLARGYWNRSELTDKKFVTLDHKRFYRSGDRVERSPNGDIYFAGRIDRQVKIRGQLVEIEEVEIALATHPNVLRCAVLAIDAERSSKKLIGFYKAERALLKEELITHLAAIVPEWMVPQELILIDEFPLTASGKIDTQALEKSIQSDEGPKGIQDTEICLPKTQVQKTLWKIWADILKRDDFGIRESFFDLGGDSIDAIDFTLRAARENIQISPSMLSRQFTIQGLSDLLEALQGQDDAMSVEELKALAQNPPFSMRTSQKSSGTAIFMTGATGFLGGRLLRDLLERTDENFICLVRAESERLGWARLNLDDQYLKRVEIVLGDLRQAQFGLGDHVWRGVCAKIKSIIHSAAVVHMGHSFEKLRAANFDSCFEVMKLALDSGAQQIDYISTLSVFVSTDQNTGIVYEDDMLGSVGYVYGGYAQSKVAAELALHNPDFTQLCPVTSYRLGLITGDQSTGQGAANDFLSRFINGLRVLGCLPEFDLETLMVDVTPVDYASDTLAKLIAKNEKKPCYHIANERGFSMAQIVVALQRRGLVLKRISLEEWRAYPKNHDLDHNAQAAWLGLCRVFGAEGFQQYRTMDLFQATDITFDQTYLKQALPNLEIPKADDALLDLYCEVILND